MIQANQNINKWYPRKRQNVFLSDLSFFGMNCIVICAAYKINDTEVYVAVDNKCQ